MLVYKHRGITLYKAITKGGLKMATPSKKSDQVNEAIYNLTGIDRIEAIQSSQCAFKCAEPNFIWRDNLSKKEYTISGLCQTCQNDIFG